MKKRILIIDDDSDLLAALKERLQAHGFFCSTLSSPEKVLERALHWKPHLILLDLGLPRITGLELLREVQKNPKLKRIPVIILSSFSDEDIVCEGMALGASGYLNKTCGARDLISTVNQYVFEGVKCSAHQ